MESVYYDPAQERLVFVRQKSTTSFWDQHWGELASQEGLVQSIKAMSEDRNLLGVARRYLQPGARILEGGCGMGGKVYGLKQHGYQAVGVDFAQKTIQAVNRALPELDLRRGDLLDLDFEDQSFDAYYSLGVIEHFYEGYEGLVREAKRVLKPGGLLLIYFPAMSWLRRRKARSGAYPHWQGTPEQLASFYQFALPPASVAAQVKSLGFKLIKGERRDGLRGLKVEGGSLSRPMDMLTRAPGRAGEVLRRMFEPLLKPWAGHSCQLIFRKL